MAYWPLGQYGFGAFYAGPTLVARRFNASACTRRNRTRTCVQSNLDISLARDHHLVNQTLTIFARPNDQRSSQSLRREVQADSYHAEAWTLSIAPSEDYGARYVDGRGQPGSRACGRHRFHLFHCVRQGCERGRMAERASDRIFLIDDDAGIVSALSRLLTAAGFSVEPYTSADDFLDRYSPQVPGCVIIDVAIGDWNGLDLQKRLSIENYDRPVIFISGQSDLHLPPAKSECQAHACRCEDRAS